VPVPDTFQCVGRDVTSLSLRPDGEVVAAVSAYDPAQLEEACAADRRGERAAGHGGGQQGQGDRQHTTTDGSEVMRA